MKIVLIGLGKVGKNIAKELSIEGHDLVVVDTNKDNVEDVSTNFDVLGITGNAVSLEILKEAKVDEADLMIAVTNTDEINMLSCLFAQKLNKNIKTIARVRNPIYSSQSEYLKSVLGITSTINPEVVTAREIVRILKYSNIVQVESFSKGRIDVISFNVTKELIIVDKTLADISKEIGDNALFVGIKRNDEIIIPHGETVIKENDLVSVIIRESDAQKFFQSINLESHGAKNVMIVGASMISFHLAKLLENSKINVTIIERDKKRCEELSRLLTNTNIIFGDASDSSILDQEGIGDMDAFVSLSNIDEENIMLSLHAKQSMNGIIATKIDHINYDSVLENMGLDPIISPKKIIANEIVAYTRALDNADGNSIFSLYRIMNDKAEVVAFDIKKDANYIGVPISDLHINDNAIICSIIRSGHVITPSGKDVIRLNDKVLVTTTQFGMKDIEDILI